MDKALDTERLPSGTEPLIKSNGPTASLRLDPAIASSDWILVRGRVEMVPQSSGRFGWLVGKKNRPEHELRGGTLEVILPDGDSPRPIALGPGGEFETRFAARLPRMRPTQRQVQFQLRVRDERIQQSLNLFSPHPSAALGIMVLAHQEPAGSSRAQSVEWPELVLLSETSRELAWLASSGESNAVFYLGLPMRHGAMHREPGWPAGLGIPIRAANAAAEPVERALWIARLMELFEGEMEFIVIADTSSLTVATLQAMKRLKVPAERLRGIFLSDTRPVARGVLRQYETPAGLDRLDLPVQVCGTLDDARRAAAECGIAVSQGNGVHAVRRFSGRARVTRHPLVFCHGMLGYSVLRMEHQDLSNYFHGLRELLTERGFHVLMPELGRTHSIEGRAEQLRRTIGRWTSEPVNIIGHSMGGLDARYMISKLDMADRVASLTTVATPHRGTYFADWFVERFDQGLPLLRGLERLGIEVDGFRDATRAACRRFNETVLDSPKVRYYSFSAFQVPRKIPPILRRSHSLIARIEGANDGLVSEASARWGEHVATLRADHIALVGDRAGEYFDHLALYRRIVEDLIRDGF